MNTLKFTNEENHKISYIINTGYYLEDENIANDELLEHTDFTNSLFLKGLRTKETVADEDILELIGYNQEKNVYYAQWYNLESGSIEYIDFTL